MEKIKLSFFDTFAYLVPGVLILISLLVAFDNTILSISDFSFLIENISTSGILFGLFIAYILGIVCNTLGHNLYLLAKKIWKKDVINQKDYHLSDAEIHVLIRELSPNNYNFLESWLGLSNMSHNIAVALLFLTVISISKIIYLEFNDIKDWIIITSLSLISSIIFLKRSIRFNNYYKTDRIATIEKLYLIEKSKPKK